MIFTIGTSNRSLPEFASELLARNVTMAIDVRSAPYSRLPWFNAGNLARWAEQAGIHYRHEGEILGGRSGVAIDHPDYAKAVARIIAMSLRERVVIFCAEGDPAKCHRTWDIGASLLVRHDVTVRSILREGNEESLVDSLRRVSQRHVHPSLRDAIAERLATGPTRTYPDMGA